MLPFTWLPKVHTRERTYECSRWVKDFSQSTLIGTVKYYYVFMVFFLFIVLKYTYIKFAILSILVYSLVNKDIHILCNEYPVLSSACINETVPIKWCRFLSSSSLWQPPCYFLSLNLTAPTTSCKKNHTVFVVLWVAYFTYHNLRYHLICDMFQN